MPQRLPTILFVVAWIGLIAIPIAIALILIAGAIDTANLNWVFNERGVQTPETRWQTFMALISGFLPWLPLAFVCWHLQALFGLYRNDDALSKEAAKHIRDIGIGLCIVAIFSVLAGMLQSVILSATNPPGERELAISVSGATVGFLVASGLMIVIGRAMVDAAIAAEDSKGFV